MSFKSARVESLQGRSEKWHNVGTTNDFSVDFQNSWANKVAADVPPAGFYKDRFNNIALRGNIDTGVSGTVCFTLPVGYRPQYKVRQIVYNNNGGPGPGGANVYVAIDTDGTVTPVYSAGTDMWLDGIRFRADD